MILPQNLAPLPVGTAGAPEQPVVSPEEDFVLEQNIYRVLLGDHGKNIPPPPPASTPSETFAGGWEAEAPCAPPASTPVFQQKPAFPEEPSAAAPAFRMSQTRARPPAMATAAASVSGRPASRLTSWRMAGIAAAVVAITFAGILLATSAGKSGFPVPDKTGTHQPAAAQGADRESPETGDSSKPAIPGATSARN